MLAIVNGVAVARFSRRQQHGVTAARYRPRLETHHAANASAATGQRTTCHTHEPVDDARLLPAAMDLAALVQILREGVAMQHDFPRATLPVKSVHRRLVR